MFLFHMAAINVTKKSISEMVNERDEAKRKQLTEHWRVAMLAQLSNVEIIVRIFEVVVLIVERIHYVPTDSTSFLRR
jgi:hypothetical protein